MFNHSPADYCCPICLGINGVEDERTLLRKTDLLYTDELVSVFMNSFFIRGNEGHVIVVPNTHIEHLYDLPEHISHRVIEVAKRYAIIIKKAYRCDGILLQQHNEPAGGQHAYHFHLHIFPRYLNDDFFEQVKKKIKTTSDERLPFINTLKKFS